VPYPRDSFIVAGWGVFFACIFANLPHRILRRQSELQEIYVPHFFASMSALIAQGTIALDDQLKQHEPKVVEAFTK